MWLMILLIVIMRMWLLISLDLFLGLLILVNGLDRLLGFRLILVMLLDSLFNLIWMVECVC